MKILVVHNQYLERGGEDAVVDSEIKMLKSYGHQVVFYGRSNREIRDSSFWVKLHFFIKEIIWSKKTYREIRDIVKKEKPDVAHLHNIFFTISPSIYYALAKEGVPVVQSLHNYRLFCPKGIFYRNAKICQECNNGNFIPSIVHRCWKNSFILSLLLARMLRFHFGKRTFQDKINTFIASSEFSKNKLIELGLSKDKIFVKPNFVGLKIERGKSRENYALFIGRLVTYKGINTLFSAYRRLPDFYLKVIGYGPLYEKLKQEAKEIGNIELLGRVHSNEKVIEHMKKSRFLIFPSECYESMPRVIVENLACGVPVIVSRLGAMAELIKDGQTGLHFSPADSQDLISKIRWALNNPERMEEIGKQGRKEFEEKYTLDKNYAILMDIYRKAIDSQEKQK